MRKLFPLYILTTLMAFSLTGCTMIFQKGRRKDIERIAQLQSEKDRLEKEFCL